MALPQVKGDGPDGAGHKGASQERVELAGKWLNHVTRLAASTAVGEAKCFDHLALNAIRDIATSPGRCTCRLTVDRPIENLGGTLHGGCIATLVDVVGTAAQMTVADSFGVSIDLNVSYISAAPHGEEVIVDAQVLRVGRYISVTQVDIRQAKTGKIVAQGRHSKFLNVGPKAKL